MHVGVPFPDEARTVQSPTLLTEEPTIDDGSTGSLAHLAACAFWRMPPEGNSQGAGAAAASDAGH
jgi:hypothetical protein